MQINTRFNVGDFVVFLHQSAVHRNNITKIKVETVGTTGKLLITYLFEEMPLVFNSPVYKYEAEVAKDVEELVSILHVV